MVVVRGFRDGLLAWCVNDYYMALDWLKDDTSLVGHMEVECGPEISAEELQKIIKDYEKDGWKFAGIAAALLRFCEKEEPLPVIYLLFVFNRKR